MKRKALCILLITTIAGSLFAGCGNNSEREQPKEDLSYLSKLKEDVYYIRHANNVCDPVYLGDTSFNEGDTTTNPSDSRTVWYSDDYDKIPTMFAGDSLIFFSKSELDEEFNLERFEDLGYTVGVRGLKETKSKRYKVSTESSEKTTFPKSPAEQILDLKNEYVIIDSIAGTELRAPEKADNPNFQKPAPISRAGTIDGLTEGYNFDVCVFDGTEEHDYTWPANVRIMASYEVEVIYDYEFESQTLIHINIPPTYHDGYYMINGVGMFRYVTGNYWDEGTDFNIPNFVAEDEDTEEEDNYEPTNLGNVTDQEQGEEGGIHRLANDSDSDAGEDDTEDLDMYATAVNELVFSVTDPGTISVEVDISGLPGSDGTVAGSVIIPTETDRVLKLSMSRMDDILQVSFPADEPGEYTIQILGVEENSISSDRVDVGYVEDGI